MHEKMFEPILHPCGVLNHRILYRILFVASNPDTWINWYNILLI